MATTLTALKALAGAFRVATTPHHAVTSAHRLTRLAARWQPRASTAYPALQSLPATDPLRMTIFRSLAHSHPGLKRPAPATAQPLRSFCDLPATTHQREQSILKPPTASHSSDIRNGVNALHLEARASPASDRTSSSSRLNVLSIQEPNLLGSTSDLRPAHAEAPRGSSEDQTSLASTTIAPNRQTGSAQLLPAASSQRTTGSSAPEAFISQLTIR